MTSLAIEQALTLMRLVATTLPSDFVGLGIVFYRSLQELPSLQLQVDEDPSFQLPIAGVDAIALTLARASSAASSYHDGFHFVDVTTWRLTHLAQYVAPPIPGRSDALPPGRGARHMTAILASRLPGIEGVGLIAHQKFLSLYADGDLSLNEKLS